MSSPPAGHAALLRPPRLRPGDRVAVIAPAGPFERENLDRGVALWRARGFEVVVPAGVFARRDYLAGTDGERAAIINEQLADPSVRALLAARGGYGSLRILDRLELGRLADDPKILIGFSDLTAIQMEAWRRLGLTTFSGPMIAGTQLTRLAAAELDVFFRTLTTAEPPPPLAGAAARVVASGRAEGVLLGGNLTLLCCLAAAGRLPSLAGALLAIEDTNETPYRVDRMLTVLRLGGHLRGVAGVVAGDFGDALPPAALDALLVDRLGELGGPIIAGVDFGHGRVNRLIALGVRARLDTAPPRVELLEAGVC